MTLLMGDMGGVVMIPCYNMATTLKSSPLERDIVLAAEAGFRHIELRKEKLLDYLRRGNSLTELRQLLDDNGLTPICINALADITFHTGQARVTVEELCHFLCYAGRFVGCRDLEVIAAFGAPTDDREEVTAETAGVLTDLSKIAADYDMRLALEYMGISKNSVRTFDHALEIVERVGRENVGLLPDTWHHFAGGSKPEDFLKASANQIFTVHVSDAPDKTPFTLRRPECIWPGDGAVPIGAMLQNLQKIGYDDIVSVEVFDPDIQRTPPESCIPAAYKRTVEALRDAGVYTGQVEMA